MQALHATRMQGAIVPARCDRAVFRGVDSRRTLGLTCRASACQGETSRAQFSQQLAAGVLTAITAVSLSVVPSAQAVSGGGGIGTPISDMDFSGKDLRKNSYTKAVMRRTNFSNSKLMGVSFFGGLAVGANFHGADLTNADLESGDFEDADFSDAVLVGAYVNGAQFTNANIKNTDWTDVQLRKDINKYLCTRAEGTNPTTGVDTRESLNCP